MNRIRMFLMIPVFLLSIGGALAEKSQNFACAYSQQYILVGGVYMPVGVYGVDYVCLNFPGTCTYYRPNPVFQPNVYAPCRQGYFIWVN
jgi:hypothetical protein